MDGTDEIGCLDLVCSDGQFRSVLLGFFMRLIVKVKMSVSYVAAIILTLIL